jgi:hypothetical protein
MYQQLILYLTVVSIVVITLAVVHNYCRPKRRGFLESTANPLDRLGKR